jgi:hypothetical protein
MAGASALAINGPNSFTDVPRFAADASMTRRGSPCGSAFGTISTRGLPEKEFSSGA